MTFHTHDLPARDRFPCWFEMATQAHVRSWVRSEHENDFAATMRVLQLGEVQVSLLSYPSLQMTRTPRLIRENDPEMYLLNLNLNGSAGLTYRGRSTIFRAGEFAFYSTSHPSQGWRSSQEEPARSLVVQFPRALPGLPAALPAGRAAWAPIPNGGGNRAARCTEPPAARGPLSPAQSPRQRTSRRGAVPEAPASPA
ncbi:hypothetical protein [Streptosporangium sp. NBC_01756]|uniref:AraC-like ligand-binding domain-containing protein n=1 Tax=Streptosporangium sp. NBC_01756 TaxID=2975950 RepID=UPI002DD98FDD|nr:hypothetical protein [Streptosporangium sp. NBC_01756]WSC90601.1 hypothetical protein OIE48_19860 [Streptosporangium sp. NBC_01756]